MPVSLSSPPRLGIGSKLVGSLVFAIFAGLGLVFIVLVTKQGAANLAAYRWQRVEATVLSSEISPARSDSSDAMLSVSYEYTFNGARHIGQNIQPGVTALENNAVYRLSSRYAVGQHVSCWVDPNHPDNAVLIRKSPFLMLFLIIPLAFVAIGGIGLYAMWCSPKETPLSNRAQANGRGRFAGAFFFGIFLLVGIGTAWPLLVHPLLKARAVKNWAAVPCKVVASRVKTHSDSDGDTYSVEIVYSYTYGGHNYVSNQYGLATFSSSGYVDKEKIVDQFPPGYATYCYVDPDAPEDAVLDRKLGFGLLFGLLPLVFMFVGAGGIRFMLRKKSGMEATGSFNAALPSPVSKATLAAGPKTLRPTQSRAQKLVLFIVMAVFWNGIVSVFLFQMFSGFRHASGISWFLAVFLIPFVLIGLVLIGAAIHQALALFDPQARLRVSSDQASPGGTVEIDWELNGRVDRLRRFRVFLEGREEATYQNGENTSTDRSVFTTIDIVQTEDPAVMRSGNGRLSLPAGAMHSFASANNKIVWSLRVKGEIPHWPGIDDEFPFVVAPLPLSK